MPLSIGEKKFNIIFDPPFSDSNFIENLKLLKNLNYTVIIISYYTERKNAEDNLDKIINFNEIKQYGRSKIIFAEII